MQKVTQRVDRVREKDSKTSYRYETVARIYTCRTLPWPQCTITAEQPIRVVYETRLMGDGKHFGVVTAYCIPNEVCPSWVNDAW